MACDQMISGDFIPSRKQISVDSGNNASMFWHERLLVGAVIVRRPRAPRFQNVYPRPVTTP
jgi:hypothetical protein